MKAILKNLWTDEGGASAAEYALILAIVGSAIALAAIGLGTAISDKVTSAANCVGGNSANYNTVCT